VKDYLKDYLAGRGGKKLPAHSRDEEVPQVPEDLVKTTKAAFGTIGTCQKVEYAENSEAQSDVEPAASPIDEPEISWRVEAMLSQIPDKGAIPFLVAREAVEPQAGCCLSCGEPLNQGNAYRCAACGRAANLALGMSLSISKAQNGG